MKISKSNFIVISITMLTVLFLFQFTNLSILYTSKATTNTYASTPLELTAFDAFQKTQLMTNTSYSTGIIGTDVHKEARLSAEWCLYQKRTYWHFENLEDFYNDFSRQCKLLIVPGDMVTSKKDISYLQKICNLGVHIIFTSMPDITLLDSSSKLQLLLGIKKIEEPSVKTSAVTFFDGFLLGGKVTYKKIKPSVPYFNLKPGTKAYAVGELEKQKNFNISNEDLPPLIWRYASETNFVFVINGSFCKDYTGLGILTSLWSETTDYSLYPIINAQSAIVQNYPYTADENSKEIEENYYYSTKSLCQVVIWPDLVSILNATHDKFSGFIAPKLEYSNTKSPALPSSLDFYFKQTEKIKGELGISGDQLEGKSMYDKKLKYDTEFMKDNVPGYTFTAFAPGDMPESVYGKYLGKEESILSSIRTMVIDNDAKNQPPLSYYNDTILSLATTLDGFSHSDEDNLFLRSMETALGYSSVSIDIKRVLYPYGKSDDWTKLSKNLSRYLNSYWKPFREAFEQTTISEADTNARRFFALDYTTHRQSKTINLSITNLHTKAHFILELGTETIDNIQGASFKKIENETYLITAFDENVSIEVKPQIHK